MGNTVDPTFPLLSVANFIGAAMLLLVLFGSVVRQSWNLGVTFLCFWLLLECITDGVNFIVWSDNAVIRLRVYCDIVSHLQLFTYVVKPMSTLIITRRLYLIASLRSVELPTQAERRRNLCLVWVLGLGIPVLVAGPLYIVNQSSRFLVLEGFGCTSAQASSILDIILIQSWGVIPPLLSITIYVPRVMRIFYHQAKDTNRFLRSNGSVTRTAYFRILALASIDILLTLPFGITAITLATIALVAVHNDAPIPWYYGWDATHQGWLEPLSIPYAALQADGRSTIADWYSTYWSSPVLAFAIFGLFGLTKEARQSYWRVVLLVGNRFGRKSVPSARRGGTVLGTMEFASGKDRGEELSPGAQTSSHPSLIDTKLSPTAADSAGNAHGTMTMPEPETEKADGDGLSSV